MLRTTEMTTAVGMRPSPRLLLAALLGVLALLLALAPASAMAGSTESDRCSASVSTADSSSLTASISVDCGNELINSVGLSTNERNEGRLEGDDGATCVPEETAVEFICQPSEDSRSSISAQFTEAQGEAICLRPALEVDFTVTFEDETTEDIENVAASGCDGSGTGEEGGGGSVDEDSGSVPEGGVDSGWAAAQTSSRPGAAVPIAAVMLTALALGAAGLTIRRTGAAR